MQSDKHLRAATANTVNSWGQVVGQPVDWTPPTLHKALTLTGQFALVRPLCVDNAAELHGRYSDDGEEIWTYMPYGPFVSAEDYRQWITEKTQSQDQFYCICNSNGSALGVFALAGISPAKGSVELAHVLFSKAMRQQAVATEAVYLMLNAVFELGYRRCEWKCNALNLASRRAAQRFGFSFEGVFRQAMVIKGHNRDTAWFGMTDGDWHTLRPYYQQWLQPDNFDSEGQQRVSLSCLTKSTLKRLEYDPLGTKTTADDL